MTNKEYKELFRILNTKFCNGLCHKCDLNKGDGECKCLLVYVEYDLIDKGIFSLSDISDMND